MEEALIQLERYQKQILQRIGELERSVLTDIVSLSSPLHPSSNGAVDFARAADVDGACSATIERLSSILLSNSVTGFVFKVAPPDYYDRPLEARRDILGAASVDHLCKSIVLVNTQSQSHVVDCRDRNNSKYYVVIVQYTARFNSEMVKNFLYTLNNGKVPRKKINLRLAPEEVSTDLTGYGYNAVTCIGMKTEIPVILDEAIMKLSPDYFWLGGGEVDLKMGIRTSEFIEFVKPFIVSCSTA